MTKMKLNLPVMRHPNKSSLVYSTITKKERLNIFSKQSRESIDLDLLDMVEATHAVVAIEWGARVVLSVEDANTDNANTNKIEGSMNVAMDLLITSLSGGAKVAVDETRIDKSRIFSFRIFGYISFPNDIPQNFAEAVDLMKQTPSLIKEANHGKGKQLKFTLIPVDTLRRLYKRELSDNVLYKSIDEELVNFFVRDFDEIQIVLQEVNDLRQDINKWKSVLPSEVYASITDISDKLSSALLKVKTQFASLLVEFRSGSKDKKVLEELRVKYYSGQYSHRRVEQMLHDFDETKGKIVLYNLFTSYGSRFIPKNAKLDNILASNFDIEIRILYFDIDTHDLSSDLIQGFLHKLKVEQAKDSNRIEHFFIDSKLEKERLSSYLNGKILVYDLFVSLGEKREYVLIADYNEPQTAILFDPITLDDIIVRKHSNLGGSFLAVVGDILYSMGGGTGKVQCTRTSNVLKSTFIWEDCGTYVTDISRMSGNALVIGSKIYFLGNTGKFWEFDTTTNITKELNRFGPGSGNNHATLVVLNGVIYGCLEMIDTVCKYLTLPSGTWQSLNTPIYDWPTLITSGSAVCVVGGYKDNDQTKKPSSSCFNTHSKTWSSGSSLNNGQYYSATARLRSGTYLIFGRTDSSPHSIEYFDERKQKYVLLNKKIPIQRPSAVAFELPIN